MSTTNVPSAVSAWELLARSAVHIINEARSARRLDRVSANGRTLLKALAALGVNLEPARPTTLPPQLRHGLSDREYAALIGMSEGKSNADIGRELYLTEDTIKTYARRLYRKLGATDRAHAVATAFRLGLLR